MEAEPGAVWRTRIRGRSTDLPATLDDIRAALPEARRAGFDRCVGSALLVDVPLVAARWSLPPEAIAEDDTLIAALRAGDDSGFVGLHDPDEEARR
ncbi:hypothetical protein ACIBSV_41240 [Embleya sp. NPDC050154]|uniref:hypothetical protein n=1 Tax=unclassified Embleya TaxID=2699296 RepID=UPI00379B03CF